MTIPLPPRLETSSVQDSIDESMKTLITNAKTMYMNHLHIKCKTLHKSPAWIVTAPGRVNLIGEHTDYTGGYVLPLAVNYGTVCYGTGHFHTSKGNAVSTITFHTVSDHGKGISSTADQSSVTVEVRKLTSVEEDLQPPNVEDVTAEYKSNWVNYITGVIVQYIPDIPPTGCSLDLAMSFSSNVPLGAGLSSSASLEVSCALFVECILQELAFSSANNVTTDDEKKLERSLRCQRAENQWAYSPCGIMDQMASNTCIVGHCMLLDCKTYEITHVPMKANTEDDPILVICNSGVTHEIQADEEYGKRRRECNEAVLAMQEVPLYHVEMLRDATVADCELAYEKNKMDDVLFKRAMHVVTENRRVIECKTALKLGLWEKVGTLMNMSQASLKDNFEVSCDEINTLCEIALGCEGVYGTRLTGGGFGGCTVTLVKKEYAQALIDTLQKQYVEKYPDKTTCDCFMTLPAGGARVLAIDMIPMD